MLTLASFGLALWCGLVAWGPGWLNRGKERTPFGIACLVFAGMAFVGVSFQIDAATDRRMQVEQQAEVVQAEKQAEVARNAAAAQAERELAEALAGYEAEARVLLADQGGVSDSRYMTQVYQSLQRVEDMELKAQLTTLYAELQSKSEEQARLAALATAKEPPDKRPSSAPPILKDWRDQRVVSDDGSVLAGATSEEGYDVMMKALSRDDKVGFYQLFGTGDVVAIGSGTRCHVLEVGFTKKRVRLMEGGNAGLAVWVASEWVRD